MKTNLVLVLTCTLLLSVRCLAQNASIPPVIAKGFEAMEKRGSIAAIDAWLAGSARETDDDFQDQVAGRMDRIKGVFGQMAGFETIRVVNLSPSTERVYVAVKFAKGVAWMSFDCVKPDKEWIVTRLEFNTNANIVLPPNLLGGQ